MSEDAELTVDGARRAADRRRLGEWVAAFLAEPGSDNEELGEQLRDEVDSWTGPIRLPFDELHRLAGPPGQPTLERLDDDDLDTVEDMGDSIDGGWDPAPLIATFDIEHDHLVLEDGNHRIEGLRRAGHHDYWTIVGFRSSNARQAFEAAHGDGHPA